MSKEQEREAAAQRVRAYLAERRTVRGLHQEQIHGFHEGHEREVLLLASDLAALASPAAEPVQALSEIVRLAQVAVRECPADQPMVNDWMDCAMKVCRALASPPATKEAKAGWIAVSARLPESGVTVLACYTNRAGNLRRICAEWIAAKSRESGSESDIGEYDEAADTFYDPEGWYERIDNWCDYTSVAVVEGEISHWMPLPPAPEGAA